MSGGQIPAYIDVRRTFVQGAEIDGSIDLERLPRFRESLASDKADVRTQLAFAVDSAGQKQIQGAITAQVEMTCQRCLEPVAVTIADTINLAVLADEAQVADLNPDWDPWICQEHKLELAEMLEEQLMLAMPIVSYHPDTDCIEGLDYQAKPVSDSQQQADSRANPFAVLKVLQEDND